MNLSPHGEKTSEENSSQGVLLVFSYEIEPALSIKPFVTLKKNILGTAQK